MRAKAALFLGSGEPFQIEELPLPEIEPGGILAFLWTRNIDGVDSGIF